MNALLPLLLALVPVPADLVAQLDSTRFSQRQQADGELRRRLTYPLALRLDWEASHAPPEARARLKRIIASYWAGIVIDTATAPHIDALSNPAVTGCNCAVSRAYLSRAVQAREAGFGLRDDQPYADFRLATVLFVEDLVRWRLPPAIIRGLLAVMKQRTQRFLEHRP